MASATSAGAKPSTPGRPEVEAYLAALPAAARRSLRRLRSAIKAAVPATLVALVATWGCAGVSPMEPQASADRLGVWIPGPGATLLHTPLSRLENPTMTVVSLPAGWRAMWTQVWGGLDASPALPEIDFVLSSVVVVGLGSRAGRTFSVTIDSVVQHVVGAVLYATEWQLGVHCGTASGVSSPLHVVHAPGHPPVTDWRVSMVRRDCASADRRRGR